MATSGFISTWPYDDLSSDEFKHVVERHITPWDVKDNRPIQIGQVLNPHTGILESPSYDIGT
ncbi:hypothetical protein IFR04_015644 [Cadophora malorum]|uniref:Uncharacterized protein n=1 Tax=Cadophora malorum TaxID=108018 RepID=A0A8H7W133_9HELO|nr:hypothetical protein IFR04_015644 [Cadophora malorum]